VVAADGLAPSEGDLLYSRAAVLASRNVGTYGLTVEEAEEIRLSVFPEEIADLGFARMERAGS
jgi:hypothetical protein